MHLKCNNSINNTQACVPANVRTIQSDYVTAWDQPRYSSSKFNQVSIYRAQSRCTCVFMPVWRTKTTNVTLLVGFRPNWASKLHVIDIYLGNESYILNITGDFSLLNTFNWLIELFTTRRVCRSHREAQNTLYIQFVEGMIMKALILLPNSVLFRGFYVAKLISITILWRCSLTRL